MSLNSYWTQIDRKIIEAVKEKSQQMILSVFHFLKKLFSFKFEEVLVLLLVLTGISLRLKGVLSSPLLLDEHHLVRQALGLTSFSSSFKYVADSFYGVLLMIPSILTVVYGTAKGWFSVFLLINPEGGVPWAYPLFVLTARFFGLALFALTTVLLYRLGNRFFNRETGTVLALLLIFSPVSLQASGFVLAQHLSLLLTGSLFYLIFLWFQRKKAVIAFYSGLCAGLLAATSFHGLYLIPFFVVFAALVAWRQALFLLAGSVLAYLAGTFYAHFDLPLRLDNVAHQILLRRDYFSECSHFEILSLWGRELSWLVLASALVSPLIYLKKKLKWFFVAVPLAFLAYFYALFSSFTVQAPADLLIVLFPAVLLSGLTLSFAASFFKRPVFKWVFYLALFCGVLYFTQSSRSDADLARFETETAASEKNFQFSPGKWSQKHIFPPHPRALWKEKFVLTYIRPMETVQKQVLEAYSSGWEPVSLREKALKVSFTAREKRLNKILIPLRETGGKKGSVQIRLLGIEGEQLTEAIGSIPAGKGWNDVAFEFNTPLIKGKKYSLELETVDGNVQALVSDKDVFLDLSQDLLFQLVYE